MASCDLNMVTTNWVKYIGTPSFNEYAYNLATSIDGTIFVLGQTDAYGISMGSTDLLVLALS